MHPRPVSYDWVWLNFEICPKMSTLLPSLLFFVNFNNKVDQRYERKKSPVG
jgi:hypothetical protein